MTQAYSREQLHRLLIGEFHISPSKRMLDAFVSYGIQPDALREALVTLKSKWKINRPDWPDEKERIKRFLLLLQSDAFLALLAELSRVGSDEAEHVLDRLVKRQEVIMTAIDLTEGEK